MSTQPAFLDYMPSPKLMKRTSYAIEQHKIVSPPMAFAKFHCIRKREAKTAVVFIHAIDGSSDYYTSMSDYLSPQVAIYGIHVPRNANYRACDSIRSMAQLYLKLLVASNVVHENLFIAGYSFGGKVALEIARQLEHNELTPKGLILVNTSPIGTSVFEDLYHGSTGRQALVGTPEHIRIISEHFSLAARYRPQPYKGQATLISSIGRNWPNYETDWTTYLKGSTSLLSVPVKNHSLFSPPNLKTIASAFNDILDQSTKDKEMPSQFIPQ